MLFVKLLIQTAHCRGMQAVLLEFGVVLNRSSSFSMSHTPLHWLGAGPILMNGQGHLLHLFGSVLELRVSVVISQARVTIVQTVRAVCSKEILEPASANVRALDTLLLHCPQANPDHQPNPCSDLLVHTAHSGLVHSEPIQAPGSRQHFFDTWSCQRSLCSCRSHTGDQLLHWHHPCCMCLLDMVGTQAHLQGPLHCRQGRLEGWALQVVALVGT